MRLAFCFLALTVLASTPACSADVAEDEEGTDDALTTPQPQSMQVTPPSYWTGGGQLRYAPNGNANLLFRVHTDRETLYRDHPSLRFATIDNGIVKVETIPSYDTGGAGFVLDAKGSPYVLLGDPLTLYTRSAQGTWSPEYVEYHIPGSKTGVWPDLAFAADGTLHAIYHRETVDLPDGTSATQLVHAVRKGSTWEKEIVTQIPQGRDAITYSSLAIAGNTVHIVYGGDYGTTPAHHATQTATGWVFEEAPAKTYDVVADRIGRIAAVGCGPAQSVVLTVLRSGKAPLTETVPFKEPASSSGCVDARLTYDSSGRPHVAVSRDGAVEYAVKDKGRWSTYKLSNDRGFGVSSIVTRTRNGRLQVGVTRHPSDLSLVLTTLAF